MSSCKYLLVISLSIFTSIPKDVWSAGYSYPIPQISQYENYYNNYFDTQPQSIGTTQYNSYENYYNNYQDRPGYYGQGNNYNYQAAAANTKPAVVNNNYAKANLIFIGGTAAKNTATGYLQGIRALNGNIYNSGSLLRVEGVYGGYRYETLSANLTNKDGTPYSSNDTTTKVKVNVSSGSLMWGYQKVFSRGYFTTYLGGNFDNYNSDRIDAGSIVKGGQGGVKGQIDFLISPANWISFFNSSSVSSAFTSYLSRSAIDFNFDGFSVGPEAIFLGSESFKQSRYGLSISNIKILSTKLSLSGGYAELNYFTKNTTSDITTSASSDNKYYGRSAYGSIGLSAIF